MFAMDVSAIPPRPPVTGSSAAPALSSAAASSLDGLQAAQDQVDQGAKAIAGGNLDPAVIVDVTSAEVDYAANAKVFKASTDLSRRLIDELA
jgi:hypothetical protein